MNDVRKIREAAPPAPLRVERSAAALVAQYIHELSARHPAQDSTQPEPALQEAA